MTGDAPRSRDRPRDSARMFGTAAPPDKLGATNRGGRTANHRASPGGGGERSRGLDTRASGRRLRSRLGAPGTPFIARRRRFVAAPYRPASARAYVPESHWPPDGRQAYSSWNTCPYRGPAVHLPWVSEERSGMAATTHSPAPPGRGVRSRYPRWWVILAVWCAWGLLWSAQLALYARLGGNAIGLGMALRLPMPLALAWAFATPGIIWLGRRFPPFGSPRWPLGVVVNLFGSMVTVFALGFVLIVNQRVVYPSPDPPPLLLAGLRSFVWWFTTDALLYWGILAIDYGVARDPEDPAR